MRRVLQTNRPCLRGHRGHQVVVLAHVHIKITLGTGDWRNFHRAGFAHHASCVHLRGHGQQIVGQSCQKSSLFHQLGAGFDR